AARCRISSLSLRHQVASAYLERPGELRRREDVGRLLPPLVDRLAAGLVEQRGDRVGRLTIGRGDDDDLALAQRARVTLAYVSRDDAARKSLAKAVAQTAPALAGQPGATTGDEVSAVGIAREH